MMTITYPTTTTGAMPTPMDSLGRGEPGSTTQSPTYAPSAIAAVALTPAGRASLEQELRQLRDERLPALTAQLAEARDEPAARHENAELVTLQHEQHRLERRAAELGWLLTVAREIAPPADGVIALGSRVEIEDEGERDVFQMVDPCEANVAAGRLSLAAPLGRALLGHRAGDEVVVAAPTGARAVRILAVS